jgi:hypothetical protein
MITADIAVARTAPRPLPRVAYVAVATLLFGAPYLAIWYFGADVLTLANESVAYRFLYSVRLLDGEGASVWVLAGFLTTAMQNVLLRGIDLILSPDAGQLMERVHLFAWATYAAHVLAIAAILTSAAFTRWLTWGDRAVVILPILGPLYLTRTSGFYYFTLPDYYLTNVVLGAAAVYVFVSEWRRENVGRPLVRSVGTGLLAGGMVVNKITMFPLALMMLTSIAMSGSVRSADVIRRYGLAGLAAAVAALLTLGAFYTFQWSAVGGMFSAWSVTVMNPGGEESFWTRYLSGYLTQYGYGFIIGLWLLMSAVALGSIRAFHVPARPRSIAVATLNLLAGAVWLYFVYKRPAGTTAFEAAVALLGLSGMMMTVACQARFGRRLAVVVLVTCAAVAATTFRYQQNIMTLRESGPWAKAVWTLQQELVAFANGRGIVVIHPENHYGYGGVPEFLLKGSADTPTWDVRETGARVIDRYAPGMRFRHEYSGIPPSAPLPAGVVVYWVDVPPLEPLADTYPILFRAETNPRNEVKRWELPYSTGRMLTAHAVLLREPVK